ncbi:MAG: hypothetical protein RL477_2034 [Pseudomonadota bacterium]|jgi:hypothetical protein
MFRIFFTFVLPLIAPTAIYLIWHAIQVRRVAAGTREDPTPSFAEMPWFMLAGAGVSLLVVMLMAIALLDEGARPGTRYTPPHMENGRLVPAETR